MIIHLVNRMDVYGWYTRRKGESSNRAVTMPFRDEQGKLSLDADSLRKHFRTRQGSGQLGIRSAGSDLTSRWLAIDIDLHEDDDSLSVSQAGNLTAALGWRKILSGRGLNPLMMDLNGIGGIHLLLAFAEPICTGSVDHFGANLVAYFWQRGFARRLEVSTDQPTWELWRLDPAALTAPIQAHSLAISCEVATFVAKSVSTSTELSDSRTSLRLCRRADTGTTILGHCAGQQLTGVPWRARRAGLVKTPGG